MSAPEKFQELTSKYFSNIKNINVYFDDTLVSGLTKEDDKSLRMVINIAREFNIRFNFTKLQ